MLDMSLQLPPLPNDTARATRAVFNLTNAYLLIGDQADLWLRDIGLTDQSLTSTQSPATRIRLALITIFQFTEDLPDRLATDAIHTRMEWKYALHLPLSTPGFDATLLQAYREQVARQPLDQRLLHYLIKKVAATGLLALAKQQDLSVTGVLTAVDNLSRIEALFEALSAALVTLAAYSPDWVRHVALPHWYEHYNRLPARLPHDRSAQERFAQIIGRDATRLLSAVEQENGLAQVPEIRSLKQIYFEQFEVVADTVKWKLPQYTNGSPVA